MEKIRRICPGFKEELALTAYYRHQRSNSCPGRQHYERIPTQTSGDSGSESSFDEHDHQTREGELDSSFCFSDCEPVLTREDAVEPLLDDPNDDDAEIDDMLEQENSSESECSFHDEEIWDDSSSTSDEVIHSESYKSKEIVLGICVFINFFQLFYKVSERAILALLVFLRTLLSLIVQLNVVAELISKSLQTIKHALRSKFGQNSVTEYVVCPKCNSLYMLQDCIIRQNGREESWLCEYVMYSRHPQISRRSKCYAQLLKRISTAKGSKLVPRKVFIYNSIISAVTSMVTRKDFLLKCEHWRNRHHNLPAGVFADVYEGQVWKEFRSLLGRPFLAQPNNHNYDETPYSAGVLYFVIQNLPRSERYRFENIILTGIIPGPREPKKHIKTFLLPIVADLKKLYTGIIIPNRQSFCGTTLIHAAISCISCDLPATRKVCGFYSFSSLYGCTKCLKEMSLIYLIVNQTTLDLILLHGNLET